MNIQPGWYIVQQADGHCEIVPIDPIDPLTQADGVAEPKETKALKDLKRWGPYASPQEAIARRVGLIRAGHCRPM